jgi:hypothetical protein
MIYVNLRFHIKCLQVYVTVQCEVVNTSLSVKVPEDGRTDRNMYTQITIHLL